MAPKTPTKSKTTSATPTATAPAKNTNPDLQLAKRPAASKKRATATSTALTVASAVVAPTAKFAGFRDPCIADMVHRSGGTIIKGDLYPAARARADEHMLGIIKRVAAYSDGGIIKAAHMLQATCDGYRRRGAYFAGIAN
jgi:hypothetical protein